MSARLPHWRKRLIAYLAEVGRSPFEEGVNDCALFLAGGVAAMTGRDYAAPYRGRYTTTRGGLRILRQDGFDDHVALAQRHLKRKPMAFAGVGDGAAVRVDGDWALGIVQGAQIYVLRPDGLALVPVTLGSFGLEV